MKTFRQSSQFKKDLKRIQNNPKKREKLKKQKKQTKTTKILQDKEGLVMAETKEKKGFNAALYAVIAGIVVAVLLALITIFAFTTRYTV